MYLVAFLGGDMELITGGYLGIFGGVTVNFVVWTAFILVGFIYLGTLISRRGESIKTFFNNFGSRAFISIYLVALFMTVVQFLVSAQDPIFTVRKMAQYLTYPTLMMMMWACFNREKDEMKLIKFSLFWLAVLIIVGVMFGERAESFFRRAPDIFTTGSYNIDKRIGGIFFGPNNTGAILAMYCPFLYYLGQRARGASRLFWLVAQITVLVLIVLTLTRVALIALVAAFVVWSFIENKQGKKIIVFILLVTCCIFFSTFLADIFLRGGDVSLLTDPKQDTFGYRIYEIWLPTIETMSKGSIFWYGTPERGFGSFIMGIRKRSIAAHNATLQYFVNFGIITALIWLYFWGKIILKGIKVAKRHNAKSLSRDMFCASLLSLVIFFLCAHSASMTSVHHMNPMWVIVFIFWKTQADMLKSAQARES